MMTNNERLKNFNEVGVEAFIVAYLSTLLFMWSANIFLILKVFPLSPYSPRLIIVILFMIFNGLRYFFMGFGCLLIVLAIVLSICAIIDIFRHNMRGYYGYSIAALCTAIFGPAIMFGITVLIGLYL